MDKEGGWISFYYFPGRVINSAGITSGGVTRCVCKSVCICGDESRRGGGAKAMKREEVRYGEIESKHRPKIFTLFRIIKYVSFQLCGSFISWQTGN